MITRTPAEVFPPGTFIKEELSARDWSTRDLAERMGGDNIDCNQCAAQLLIYAPNKGIILDEDTAAGLAKAFGTSKEYWENLDRAWRAHEAEEE